MQGFEHNYGFIPFSSLSTGSSDFSQLIATHKRFDCLNPRRSPRPGQIPLIETRSEKPPEVKTQEGYMY